MLKGIGASPGIGIGKAVVLKEIHLDDTAVKYTCAVAEKARLAKAVADFIAATECRAHQLARSAGAKEAAILQGHIALLTDPVLRRQMDESINAGATAAAAADTVCTRFFNTLAATKDDVMCQRAGDIKDIRDRLLCILSGIQRREIVDAPKGSVLVAKAFPPSAFGQINKEKVAAIVAESGGINCHSAILARAMGIPAVFSVHNATRLLSPGELLIADGGNGEVITAPCKSQLREYTQMRQAFLKEKERLNVYIHQPIVTKSGVTKKVYGNIGSAEEVLHVLQNGGEGIGLFRTEFLFAGKTAAPAEAEQLAAYAAVAKAMGEKEVIIRTLDIGGDKTIPYLKTEKEDNPLLGCRGIRYCLAHQALFQTQIRAILRAAVCGNVKMLLPFITCLEEVRAAKAIVAECAAQLEREGLAFRRVPLGVMIETPAAALISDLLAKEADFFSVGTNDLTAYTMATDRNGAACGRLYNEAQPAVGRAIEMAVKNAKKERIKVGVCGEAAANAKYTAQLLAWGTDVFSVAPSSILQTKKTIWGTLDKESSDNESLVLFDRFHPS